MSENSISVETTAAPSEVVAEYVVTDSAEVYKKFTKVEGLRTLLRFILPLSLIFILFGIIGLLPSETGEDVTGGAIAFLVLAVAFPLLFCAALWFAMSRQLKTNKAYFAGAMTVTFFDDCFWVRMSGDGVESVEKLGFDKIYKVKKNKGLTVIYVSSQSVFLIDKKYLTLGSEAILKEKFRATLGKKFKNYEKD